MLDKSDWYGKAYTSMFALLHCGLEMTGASDE